MKIIIFSDIHYGEDIKHSQFNEKYYASSFGTFENLLPKIKPLTNDYDLVINLGDLIDDTNIDSDLERYKKVIKLFGDEKPVKHVLGNHDLFNLTREQIAEIIKENKCYYSFDLDGYHHIILDGIQDSQEESCSIDEEQLNWLREDLGKTDLSTIVYCHYPIDDQSLESNYYFKGAPERAFIQNKEEVRSILESSEKVIAVFEGHLHFFSEQSINGIKYITVPAFTEKDKDRRPKAEYLSVNLAGKDISTTLNKIQ